MPSLTGSIHIDTKEITEAISKALLQMIEHDLWHESTRRDTPREFVVPVKAVEPVASRRAIALDMR